MKRYSFGFGFVDVIVGTALMLILFLALMGVLRTSLLLSTMTKADEAATELANTQIEYLRGLSYDALGTSGGIPSGAIPQSSTSVVDGVSYTVHTLIQYQDDPADGVGAADTNGVAEDYKVAKVSVSYSIFGIAKSLSLVTTIVPPGIESSTGGGTLSLHVVDAAGADVDGATVQLVNTTLASPVNLTRLSNPSGLVLLGGAPPSTDYQVTVSRPGYSTAQTYARTGTNVNPTPGYLTVTQNMTTSATFAIDALASWTIQSITFATTTSFRDTFSDSSQLSGQNHTTVTAQGIELEDSQLSGTAHSIPISPSGLTGWGLLSATLTHPSGTTAVVRVLDASGVPLPDAALAGNTTGFSEFPVSLTGLATSTYPTLTLDAELTTTDPDVTPSVRSWSLSHTSAPLPYPNLAFTLTGAKSIGTNASSQPIPKTTLSATTDASGVHVESVEWDGYTLSVSGTTMKESCPSGPYTLLPGQATTTTLLVGAPGAINLSLSIENSTGDPVPRAKVILTKSGFAATEIGSECGLVFFNAIPSGTYSATVSAIGHAEATFPNISVAGALSETTLTLP